MAIILKSIRFFSFLTIVFLFSCKNETKNSNIPNVAVNIYISLQDPEFIDLAVPTGWVYVTGGSRGVIIYRVNQDEFVAYDRHCTYDPASSCGLVEMDVTNVTLSDACCGSVFSVFSGIPNQGPATRALKAYQTTFDGNFLRVFN